MIFTQEVLKNCLEVWFTCKVIYNIQSNLVMELQILITLGSSF